MRDQDVIEQLMAENEVLRKTLEDHLGAELRIAAQMRVLLKELSTFGPAATANVLTWVFAPFMRTSSSFYEHQFYDRRALKAAAPQPPVVEQKPAEPSIGKRLRDRRVELNLTQNKVARAMGEGVFQSHVSAIEHDKPVPSGFVERMQKVLEEFGKPVAEPKLEVHRNNGEKIKMCPYCEKGPYTRQGLGGHVWASHGIRLSEVPE